MVCPTFSITFPLLSAQNVFPALKRGRCSRSYTANFRYFSSQYVHLAISKTSLETLNVPNVQNIASRTQAGKVVNASEDFFARRGNVFQIIAQVLYLRFVIVQLPLTP